MKTRGNTLISLLAALAIIAILSSVYMFGGFGGSLAANTHSSPRPDGLGNTIPGLVKAKAQDEVCRSNLAQLRAALQIAATNNDDHFPASLQETKLGDQFYKCPMGNEPYQYDPSTGQVRCPHPGHGKF